MRTLVIRVDPSQLSSWKQELRNLLPELNVVLWNEDSYDPQHVRYAVVWNPPRGWLAEFASLECVVSVGAGVDHVLNDPAYPRHVPLIRTVSEQLRAQMTEYLILHVLRFHRRLPEIEAAQRSGKWLQCSAPPAGETQIGFMGLGYLGAAAAKTLLSMGYRVSGWSRRGRPVDGVAVHFGWIGLLQMVAESNILICLLPCTPATENILGASVFNAMPPGSALINVGRGEHLVEDDLISALESGRLRGATLDVFREEPVPRTSLWSHPKILVTMHSATTVEPVMGGQIVASNLIAFMRGDTLPTIVDRTRGY
jgi:glyoxylate/hydroxypyruvate reductase